MYASGNRENHHGNDNDCRYFGPVAMPALVLAWCHDEGNTVQ